MKLGYESRGVEKGAIKLLHPTSMRVNWRQQEENDDAINIYNRFFY